MDSFSSYQLLDGVVSLAFCEGRICLWLCLVLSLTHFCGIRVITSERSRAKEKECRCCLSLKAPANYPPIQTTTTTTDPACIPLVVHRERQRSIPNTNYHRPFTSRELPYPYIEDFSLFSRLVVARDRRALRRLSVCPTFRLRFLLARVHPRLLKASLYLSRVCKHTKLTSEPIICTKSDDSLDHQRVRETSNELFIIVR